MSCTLVMFLIAGLVLETLCKIQRVSKTVKDCRNSCEYPIFCTKMRAIHVATEKIQLAAQNDRISSKVRLCNAHLRSSDARVGSVGVPEGVSILSPLVFFGCLRFVGFLISKNVFHRK